MTLGESVRIPQRGKGRLRLWAASVGGQAILLLLWGFLLFGLKDPVLFRKAAGDALLLCIGQVIPVLFPMAAAGGLLTCMTAPPRFLCRLPGRLFRLSDASVGVLLLSLFAGFPIGAMLASRLLEAGKIGEEEASRLSCYTNNASAAFLVSCAGAGFFGSAKLGWILWISSTLAVLTVAVILAKKAPYPAGETSAEAQGMPDPAMLARSVANTAMGMLKLTAFVVFFAVFCAFLDESMAWLFPKGIGGRTVRAILAVFFEITGGLRALAELSLPLVVRMTMAGAATGFGGLSVFFQCMAAGDTVKADRYLSARLLTAVLCGAFAGILTLLFG